MINQNLPQIGDLAPAFEFESPRGVLRFPEYSAGCWCVFFAHPANFTSAWAMFSAFLAMKERWLNERNTRVLALSNEPIGQNDWSDKARRFIGIYLKAPVVEDLDFRIASRYGLASGRRPQPGLDRLALIIDPEGIIRLIINRPLPNIETAILDIQTEFDRLLGNAPPKPPLLLPGYQETLERSDASDLPYKPKPAHFSRKKLHSN